MGCIFLKKERVLSFVVFFKNIFKTKGFWISMFLLFLCEKQEEAFAEMEVIPHQDIEVSGENRTSSHFLLLVVHRYVVSIHSSNIVKVVSNPLFYRQSHSFCVSDLNFCFSAKDCHFNWIRLKNRLRNFLIDCPQRSFYWIFVLQVLWLNLFKKSLAK